MSENEKENHIDRRNFLKLGAIGALAGVADVTGRPLITNASETAERGALPFLVKEHDEFPVEVRDDYRPPRNVDLIFGHAFFGRILKAGGMEVDEEIIEVGDRFLEKFNYHFDNERRGYNQVAKALGGGAWALSNTGVGPSPGAISDFGLFNWRQGEDKNPIALMDLDFVNENQYQFETKAEAAQAIKRAARLYGADLVGITPRDTRWDYAAFFNPVPPDVRGVIAPPTPEMMPHIGDMMDAYFASGESLHGWEKFPFEPKTVIVVAFEMDYDALSTSPSEVAAAGVAEGYSRMAKTAYQLSVFIKQLGYHAVPAGNDTGLSIPYGIAAGLGEASRAGLLITPKYGPRVRLAKVYTDLDFVEYDKPITFGVTDFCKRCKRCADSCPSGAIPFDDEPSFEPTHENKDNAYFNAAGTKKWYVDCRKCFQFWEENGVDCANCVASCPYNKPDFWHHRLVNQITRGAGGFVHTIMKELDESFGYGNTFDEEAVDRFWESEA
ncbi:MAG: reductive dehalogenase [Chloroflexota bacterium]